MTRHSWKGEPVRTEHRTERTCGRCGMLRVTRHEATIWTEWYRDGRQIESERTPPCDARLEWQTGEFDDE